MTDLYAEHLAAGGEAPGRFYTPAVRITEDFKRIRALPRRVWQDHPDQAELIRTLSEWLRRPGSTATLRPAQAQILAEAMAFKGSFYPARVGAGKTLVSLLLSVVLKAKRPVLLVPANQLGRTRDEAREYAKDWCIAGTELRGERSNPITLLSYEQISTPRAARRRFKDLPEDAPDPSGGDLLEQYDPDLFLCDEADALKNPAAAITKRVRRLLRRKRAAGETCIFIPMSGSFWTEGMGEYWHLIRWALGDENAPVPIKWYEMREWGDAIDESVPDEKRLDPGVLEHLSPANPDDEGLDDLARARRAYRRRLVETPGVISTGEDIPKVPFELTALDRREDLPKSLRDAIDAMRVTEETPGGDHIECRVTLWAHEQELALGFYSVWDPMPPIEWRAARRDWHIFVRETLKHSRTWDSPGHVALAIDNGKLPEGAEVLRAWREIGPTFVPNSVPVWVDDTPLRMAADWIAQHPKRGLVWIGSRPGGERLSQLSRVPFFSEKASDPRGIRVDKHTSSAIVSVHSCRKGLNLQFGWSENLMLTVMGKNKAHEQLWGRTVRDLQTADKVTAELWLFTIGHFGSLNRALRQAQMVEDTGGTPQKLGIAKKTIPDLEQVLDAAEREAAKRKRKQQ